MRRALRASVVLGAVLFALASVSSAEEPLNPAAAAVKTQIMTSPADVKWGPCPPALPAGAQCAMLEGDPSVPNRLYTIRSRMPAGYRIPPHYHPTDEHLTVLSGTFHMGTGETFDTKSGHGMSAGSYMVMPHGTRHYAWTEGEVVLQVHGIGPFVLTYVNPKDDPRNAGGHAGH